MGWKVRKPTDGNHQGWAVLNDKGHWLAEGLAETDAMIMAAAHELFDALSGLVATVEWEAEGRGEEFTDNERAALKKAIAAIRKAQGTEG